MDSFSSWSTTENITKNCNNVFIVGILFYSSRQDEKVSASFKVTNNMPCIFPPSLPQKISSILPPSLSLLPIYTTTHSFAHFLLHLSIFLLPVQHSTYSTCVLIASQFSELKHVKKFDSFDHLVYYSKKSNAVQFSTMAVYFGLRFFAEPMSLFLCYT